MQSLGALFVIRLITLLNIVDDLRGPDASQCLCDVDTKYIRPTHIVTRGMTPPLSNLLNITFHKSTTILMKGGIESRIY